MSNSSILTPEKKTTHFFISRNFTLLWLGQAISNIGDYVFDTTLVLWIATIIAEGKTWAPIAVSGVLLSVSLPTFLIGPLAGVFAERWDKRQTMLQMDLLRALLVALLILGTGQIPLPFLPSGEAFIFLQLGFIYTIVFLTTTCAQFFEPSRFSLMSTIVSEPDRARASGLGQTTRNIAVIIGPALAAPLLFSIGLEWALIINALSFFLSFLAILAIRHPQQTEQSNKVTQKTHFWQEFMEGLRFFLQNHTLRTLLICLAIVACGTGALNTLSVFFITENLHVDKSLYGLFGTALGLGSIVGALLATIFAQRLGVLKTFWGGLILMGVLILLYSRQTAMAPALVLFFLIGIPVTAVNTVLGPIIMHATPQNLLGRIIAVLTPTISLATMIAIIIVSNIATLMENFSVTLMGMTFHSTDTIFMGTALLVVAAGIYAFWNMRGISLGTKN